MLWIFPKYDAIFFCRKKINKLFNDALNTFLHDNKQLWLLQLTTFCKIWATLERVDTQLPICDTRGLCQRCCCCCCCSPQCSWGRGRGGWCSCSTSRCAQTAACAAAADGDAAPSRGVRCTQPSSSGTSASQRRSPAPRGPRGGRWSAPPAGRGNRSVKTISKNEWMNECLTTWKTDRLLGVRKR